MYLLKDKFDEVCLRLDHGRRLESAGSDPIYYLVFPVSEILAVKRQTRAWVVKLEHLEWHVTTFSMAEAVNSILRGHK
ncbi:MAG: BREX protein BrxB domain-containing protein, partial [Limisphaerales bacterium]